MTARTDRDLLRSLLRIDGWFTVGLVVLICATLAWSLDDALLVLGRDEYTDFLFWAAMGGFAAGFLGPLVGWSRWTTHIIGAIFAALLVALLVGWVLVPDGADPGVLFQHTTNDVVAAWSDLVLAGRLATPVFGHHLLVLGLITWGTAQFASYAAFGHRRPINAVVVVGLLLIANMLLTVRPQLTFLVIFSIASLFLLVRFHTLDEQSDWLRRRIGDPAAISALYLRGGTVFIIAAISGSLVLTHAASSSPLAGAWTEVGARAVEWGQFLERFLPQGGPGRALGPSFGSDSPVGRQWQNGDQPQLRVEFPASDPTAVANPPFLAAAYYNEFDLSGWRRTGQVEQPRGAGEEMLAGTGDVVSRAGRRTLVTKITPLLPGSTVFIPGTLSQLDQPSTIELVGTPGFIAAVDRNFGSDPYTVTTFLPADEKEGGLTQERLRAAGTAYPPDIVATYGKKTVPPGALGTAAKALLADIEERSPSNDPYDLAKTIESTLRDNTQFRYDTDLTDENCQDESVVECFALLKAGFCQYYASTMAILLRELEIPARYVQGYLPGEPDASGGGRTIRSHDAHAWVQAYFPGYGWVDFDPTGNPDQPARFAPIPSGKPVPSGTPKASGSGAAGALPSIPRDDGRDPGAGGSITRRNQAPPGLFIAIALLLGVVVASIAAVAYRRGPRGPVTPDDAYGSVSKIAARLGFGPRPTQTVYEYAGALADELPMVRPELETVARAKVEVAYGGRMLTDERMANLKSAYRRLRVQLLRLVTRRRRRLTRWRR
jgi:hypothetical protein